MSACSVIFLHPHLSNQKPTSEEKTKEASQGPIKVTSNSAHKFNQVVLRWYVGNLLTKQNYSCAMIKTFCQTYTFITDGKVI